MPKYRQIDGEAPDPLEVAVKAAQAPRTEGPAETGIPVPVGEDRVAIALELLAKVVANQQSGSSEQLDKIAAFLMRQEETRPHENLFNPPLISSLNPLGERDNPRPDLKCKTIYVGYELQKDGLTRAEIELLNRLKPGQFRVTKADNRQIPFTVAHKLDEAGSLELVTITFPCKGPENKTNHQPMVDYLRQVLGEGMTTEQLLTQIDALKRQLAERPGVGNPV